MSNIPPKNKIKRLLPFFSVGMGLVLLVLTTSLILRQSRPFVAATGMPDSPHTVEETFPEITRVSLAESKAAWDNRKAIFIDVRDSDAYAESHIPGALSVSLVELQERSAGLAASQWIITYCT